ncbi:MAG: SDR family oxidoreductase [Thermoanaerobaculia bacterium]
MKPEGTTVLITGSTSGVGREVALRLGKAGATVLVHGRDRSSGEEVVEAIRERGDGHGVFYRADLASLDEVRGLAEAVLADDDRLDLLINNAGIGLGRSGTGRETSADGYELRFAVNYLAGFLLTRLLLQRILASAPARIVNVASGAQDPIDFDDVMLERGYSGSRAYGQSKLAQVLFTFDLARELEGTGVTVNCLHPATLMDTKLVRESGLPPATGVDEGAKAILHVAASPETEGRTGVYFEGRRPARAHDQAYDEDARERLRELSVELTGAPEHQPA